MSYISNGLNTTYNFGSAATKTTSVAKKDVEVLYKYANNVALTEKTDTFASSATSNMGSCAFFEGLPFVKLLLKNRKVSGKAVNTEMKALASKNKKALNNLIKGDGNIIKRILNYMGSAKESKVAFDSVKKSTKLAHKFNKTAQKAVKAEAKGLTEQAAKYATKAEKLKGRATAAKSSVHAEINALGKTVAETGKFKKFMKSSGFGIMLVFSGVSELFTEVVPTFKELGKKKGLKQVGKSAIKVVGDTVGFIAGETAGTAVGTAIGTAICPVIGTAIGAVCGFMGGLIGSSVSGKITSKITGNSEREIARKNQENKNISEIAQDSDSLEELKSAVELKITQELATTGKMSDDSIKAQETLTKLNANNPFITYA